MTNRSNMVEITINPIFAIKCDSICFICPIVSSINIKFSVIPIIDGGSFPCCGDYIRGCIFRNFSNIAINDSEYSCIRFIIRSENLNLKRFPITCLSHATTERRNTTHSFFIIHYGRFGILTFKKVFNTLKRMLSDCAGLTSTVYNNKCCIVFVGHSRFHISRITM